MSLAQMRDTGAAENYTKRMDQTRDGAGWPREMDPLDPLAVFPSERDSGTSSTSRAPRTFSALSAADQGRTSARREGSVDAHTESVVSCTPPGTSLWAMVRALPPSARWMTCLAVLVPSLATLVLLRMPTLSTAGPRDPVQGVAVGVTARPVENSRDAQRATQRSRLSAPRDTNNPVVISTPTERTTSARTFPRPQTRAPLAQPASQSTPAKSPAPTAAAPTRSADQAPVETIVPDDGATTGVAPPPARTTSSDRLRYRGTLSVESQPAGGQVSVDGQPVGVTPLVGWELPAGSHVVRIDLDGYERWSTSIQVVADKAANVVTNLRPARHD